MTEQKTAHNWRFWPVIVLVFIFGFSSPLIIFAAPIYFLQQGVEIIIISILSTALTITYSISPLILNKFSNKLGRRKSVIIAMIGATLAELIFYVTLNPIIFIFERLFEGFILGFFFPNLQASISDNIYIDHKKYLANFNLSWGIAGVFGVLFGAIFLQFVNDLRILFYINPIFLFTNVIVAIIFFQEPNNYKQVSPKNEFDEINIENNESWLEVVRFYIPVIIPLLLILGVSFASGNGTLLYPIKSVILGYHASSTYFLMVFAIITQSFATYLSNLIGIKKTKLLSSFTLLVYAVLFIIFVFNESFLVFVFLFAFSGVFYGILYGLASNLILNLNIIKKTSIYSSILESSMGLFFFISQIILGLAADIDVNIAYMTLSIMLIFIFIINLVFLRNFKERC
ncbi:MAG: MFS transporter [Candidatus Thorarchaeota archaeon]